MKRVSSAQIASISLQVPIFDRRRVVSGLLIILETKVAKLYRDKITAHPLITNSLFMLFDINQVFTRPSEKHTCIPAYRKHGPTEAIMVIRFKCYFLRYRTHT